MKVLSLFDGISCAQVALERAGITTHTYYAAEVDRHAIQITQHNYPSTVQLGDVTNWRDWDIDWSSIGLLIGGSPCQGFSFAGKQRAFADPRSVLFFVYFDILSHIRSVNPGVKFLLENVKMKKESLDVISEMLGVEPVFLNSSLLSAQNRQRFYWANWSFGQPDDKGISLSDIITDGVVDRDKSHCIDANYFKGGNLESYFGRHRRQLVFTDHSYTVYRKLTPLECERLQTVGDKYSLITNEDGKQLVSNTQRYKALGNGFTVDVIAHILRNLE